MRARARVRALSAAVALSLAAEGCAADVSNVTTAAIFGGTPIPGQDHGAVLITFQGATGSYIMVCSGTLLTRRVVATAAHCVQGALPGVHFNVHFLDRFEVGPQLFEGQVDDVERPTNALWIHPDAVSGAPQSGHDLALLSFDPPAPDSVAPMPVRRLRLTPADVGGDIRIIGFGDTTPLGDSGEKQEIRAHLRELRPLFFRSDLPLDEGIAGGDSGGPVLLTEPQGELLIGLTSFLIAGVDGYTRLDVDLDEIEAFIVQHDPQPAHDCGADAICGQGCAAPDPDCPCAHDGFCDAGCADTDLDPDCPLDCGANLVCQRSGCPAPDPDCGNAAVGDSCVENRNCVTDLCAANGADKVCAVACNAATPCADGFTCRSGACLADTGGGCAAGGRAGGGGAAAALALLVLICAGRLRRRRDARRASTPSRRCARSDALPGRLHSSDAGP